jgi:hypothetical protein
MRANLRTSDSIDFERTAAIMDMEELEIAAKALINSLGLGILQTDSNKGASWLRCRATAVSTIWSFLLLISGSYESGVVCLI